MTFKEAIVKCIEGQKIRIKNWYKDEYVIYKSEHGFRICNKNNFLNYYFVNGCDLATWEIYNPFLNMRETMQALLDGKKICHRGWLSTKFIYLNADGNIVDNNGIKFNIIERDYQLYTE